jgi:hypothetical protein
VTRVSPRGPLRSQVDTARHSPRRLHALISRLRADGDIPAAGPDGAALSGRSSAALREWLQQPPVAGVPRGASVSPLLSQRGCGASTPFLLCKKGHCAKRDTVQKGTLCKKGHCAKRDTVQKGTALFILSVARSGGGGAEVGARSQRCSHACTASTAPPSGANPTSPSASSCPRRPRRAAGRPYLGARDESDRRDGSGRREAGGRPNGRGGHFLAGAVGVTRAGGRRARVVDLDQLVLFAAALLEHDAQASHAASPLPCLRESTRAGWFL